MIEGIQNQKLKKWIEEVVQLCQPSKVMLCDGSDQENAALCKELEKSGTFIPLNAHKHPNSFLARSNPDDVARVEGRTFICSRTQEEAGPTNNWADPDEMRQTLDTLFKGCMQGRTLYIIPFSMGPLGSKIARIGVELTDSPYVVVNMRIMTRMGKEVLDVLGDQDFVPCLHSVGLPLKGGETDVPWPCHPEEVHVAHFPETKQIFSYGSGYGGNALLGKKCFALRIASLMAKEQGWLAEHMLILGLTNPKGVKKYIAAAFPSACGKTNLAMMRSSLPGWKVETVGDDIAWMQFGADGRLYAINPEAGFFGVAPGTSEKSNPNALKSCQKNAIFTNVALDGDNNVWWEGMTEETPSSLTDWYGNPWTPDSDHPAAHPNSRFTAPARQCPVIDPKWEDPSGVPISAIIFGGRRGTTLPLVTEALSWEHGVYMGASLSSETTAAAKGALGKLRHDPFAMLPFCGYNMGDYFGHWLAIGQKERAEKLPKIYSVNWFLKGEDGKYLWPGFGENARVLKWIFERTEGNAPGEDTPIGVVPTKEGIDLENLFLRPGAIEKLLFVDKEMWLQEVVSMRDYLIQFGEHLPKGIIQQLDLLQTRLTAKQTK